MFSGLLILGRLCCRCYSINFFVYFSYLFSLRFCFFNCLKGIGPLVLYLLLMISVIPPFPKTKKEEESSRFLPPSQILDLFFSISLSLPRPMASSSGVDIESSYTALSSLEDVIAILRRVSAFGTLFPNCFPMVLF